METNLVLRALASSPAVQKLCAALPSAGDHLTIGGAIGSLGSATIAALHRAHPGRVFVVAAESPRDAIALENDLSLIHI